MNEHSFLPPRDQLARPSAELGRRMDRLFAAAARRPSRPTITVFPWRRLLLPVGAAAALALCLLAPWHQRRGATGVATVELIELSPEVAGTASPSRPPEDEFNLSIRSY